MKKIVIVGAGFSGSIMARKIAEELDREVLLVERRNHIGGNSYDEYDEYGILIQKYGPHFINTDNYDVIRFLLQYGDLFRHDAKLLSYIDGEYVQLPFNFRTMQQLAGDERSVDLLKAMRKEFSGRDRVPVFELLDSDNAEVRSYGELLFEKAYRTYTSKQWGIPPEQIDKSVLERVPMAMSFDERYLNKDFQYLPKHGYTSIFKNLFDHPNIHLYLDCDALKHIEFDDSNALIRFDGEEVELLFYTGEVDELFGWKYGKLPYRSLVLQDEYFDQEQVLPCEIISYPQAADYTRRTEYKRLTWNAPKCKKTVVVTEYPVDYVPGDPKTGIPYYPVLTEDSRRMYQRYLDETKKYGNIVLCGRLAEFKYYNMDISIEHALQKFEEIKPRLETKL